MQTSLSFAIDNRLPEILSRVSEGSSDKPRSTDPIRQLVFAMVSAGLAPAVGRAIFSHVCRSYSTWARLADADPADLSRFLVGVRAPLDRARRVVEALNAIRDERGAIELDFLGRQSTAAARSWLAALPGVSDSIADAVLAFSDLDRPTLALDVEAGRVIRRLGLCPEGTPASALSRHVVERSPADWDSDAFRRLSVGLQRVARQFCHQDRSAACDRCPLADLCPSAERASASVLPFRPRAA